MIISRWRPIEVFCEECRWTGRRTIGKRTLDAVMAKPCPRCGEVISGLLAVELELHDDLMAVTLTDRRF